MKRIFAILMLCLLFCIIEVQAQKPIINAVRAVASHDYVATFHYPRNLTRGMPAQVIVQLKPANTASYVTRWREGYLTDSIKFRLSRALNFGDVIHAKFTSKYIHLANRPQPLTWNENKDNSIKIGIYIDNDYPSNTVVTPGKLTIETEDDTDPILEEEINMGLDELVTNLLHSSGDKRTDKLETEMPNFSKMQRFEIIKKGYENKELDLSELYKLFIETKVIDGNIVSQIDLENIVHTGYFSPLYREGNKANIRALIGFIIDKKLFGDDWQSAVYQSLSFDEKFRPDQIAKTRPTRKAFIGEDIIVDGKRIVTPKFPIGFKDKTN